MRHPFESIPPGQLRRFFVPAFLLYLALQVAFAGLDLPLRTTAAPNGVLSFEFAGSAANARAILDSWDGTSRLYASFGLGLDFLFMAAYSTVIGLGCVWAGRVLAGRVLRASAFASILAWGLVAAVVFDAGENLLLLAQLLDGPALNLAEFAKICASAKFALIIVGLVYVGYGAAAFLLGRRQTRVGLTTTKGS